MKESQAQSEVKVEAMGGVAALVIIGTVKPNVDPRLSLSFVFCSVSLDWAHPRCKNL